MARKAQPFGGLPRRHVRRITAYLDFLKETASKRRSLPPGVIRAVFSGERLVSEPTVLSIEFGRSVARPEWLRILRPPHPPPTWLPQWPVPRFRPDKPPKLSSAEKLKQQQNTHALFAWVGLVLLGDVRGARDRLARAGIEDKYVIDALNDGLKVLRKKRLGRLMDLNPHQSFAAIGIISERDTKHRAALPAPSSPDVSTRGAEP
jgi:hypothetical protein